MNRQTVYLDTLLGRKVIDINGQCAGRIEEVIARYDSNQCVVEEFLLGPSALLERLSIIHVARQLIGLLGAQHYRPSYRVPWDKMDLKDPRHPRLRCPASSLRTLD